MKIAPALIENYISKIDKEKIIGCLIYGAVPALVEYRAKIIKKKIVDNLSDPFLVSNLSGEKFIANSSILCDEFFSYSMLGGRKLVNASEPNSQFLEQLKFLLKNDVKDNENFLLIQAEDLDKNSALRKLCEDSPIMATIACYEEDERMIKKYILDSLKNLKINSSKEIIDFIFKFCGKNRQIIDSELSKISTFLDSRTEISIDELELLISDDSEISVNEFINFFVAKNYEKACESLSKLLRDGFVIISIIRFLSNYVQKLFAAKLEIIERKADFEEVIKSQRLFFKAEPEFRKALISLTLRDLTEFLNLLQTLEEKIKSSNQFPQKIIFFNFLKDSLLRSQ